MINFVHDDVLHWAEHYNGPKFHAALLDGPYHLNFMGKKWDASGPDAICFQPDTWAALAEHLHDGAFIMAFSGARTYHRMACAIEDAGFVLHSMIGWTYGSGFPKATNIAAQIDKAAGVKGEVIGNGYCGGTGNHYCNENAGRSRDFLKGEFDIVAPATPIAQTWQGHRYGLQALKPAMEPICVAQKPYKGKPVDCITQTGAGALNIDAGRVVTTDTYSYGIQPQGGRSGGIMGNVVSRPPTESNALGRWPANFLLSHLPTCNGVCDESCPVRLLGEQSGECRSAGMYPTTYITQDNNTIYQKGVGNTQGQLYDDQGTAARFFFNADFSLDQQEALDNAAPFYYAAKASRRERDAGLEDMPLKHLAEKPGRNNCMNSKKDLRYEDREMAITSPAKNNHPCVKPLKLTRYLASLLLPPDAYASRRLLNCFGGSASEAIGAMLAGWDEITYIEREVEYLPIAQKRAAYWRAQMLRQQPSLLEVE